MQNAWTMDHGLVPGAGAREAGCGRSCNSNPNQNQSANSNPIPKEGGSDAAHLVAAIEALNLTVDNMNKGLTTRMTKMESQIETVEKKVKSMTEYSDYITLRNIRDKLDDVGRKVDSVDYKVGHISSKVDSIGNKVDRIR